jgi:hypothetical protein
MGGLGQARIILPSVGMAYMEIVLVFVGRFCRILDNYGLLSGCKHMPAKFHLENKKSRLFQYPYGLQPQLT